MKLNHQKAWVVAVDMGYGHQRAADPLRKIAYQGEVINANNYPGIPATDRATWEDSRKIYEFVSRFKKVPVLGELAFGIMDKIQEIPEFYPNRDLSNSNIQVRYMMHLIEKKRWGEHLIKKLSKTKLPFVTTFFAPSFMAEYYNYPGEIFVVCTDTDISRSWVPVEPATSRIKYLAPSTRVVDRLRRYGVDDSKIFLTGFPLPVEIMGTKKLNLLRRDIGARLSNLDPERQYISRFSDSIKKHLGAENFPKRKSDHPLTITFAVGGAGAQREIGISIVKSLQEKIKRHKLRVFLVAGTHADIKSYFRKELIELGLKNELGKYVKIIHCVDKSAYFKKFNQAMRETDILWTKPSELSFYTALGLPIIMSGAIGSQEKFNRRWLFMIGSGIEQENPDYTDEWLTDLIKTGWFAEAAMQGFLEAPKYGTYNIQKVISAKEDECYKCKTEMLY